MKSFIFQIRDSYVIFFVCPKKAFCKLQLIAACTCTTNVVLCKHMRAYLHICPHGTGCLNEVPYAVLDKKCPNMA